MSVSEVMSYIKGKSALMFYDRHPEMRTKWGDRHLWARGYYVLTEQMTVLAVLVHVSSQGINFGDRFPLVFLDK